MLCGHSLDLPSATSKTWAVDITSTIK